MTPSRKSDVPGETNCQKVECTISSDMALLPVWLPLDGFSERFVPNRFRALKKGSARPKT